MLHAGKLHEQSVGDGRRFPRGRPCAPPRDSFEPKSACPPLSRRQRKLVSLARSRTKVRAKEYQAPALLLLRLDFFASSSIEGKDRACVKVFSSGILPVCSACFIISIACPAFVGTTTVAARRPRLTYSWPVFGMPSIPRNGFVRYCSRSAAAPIS